MKQSDSSEPPRTRVAVVVLAAGQGTRMRSPRPKVLHTVAGRPMVLHALALARALEANPIAAVVGPAMSELRTALGEVPAVEQSERLGTGHAVLQARELLAGRSDRVLVLYGDTPLLRPETLRQLLAELDSATMAVLTAELPDPSGYGRIVRTADGSLRAIVEEREADPDVLRFREINSGVMAFRADWLWERVGALSRRSTGEYYLTDLAARALADGQRVGAVKTDDPTEALGVNSQAELAQANGIAWRRAVERLMQNGVTILDPAATYVEPDVEVGPGTVLYPGTHLQSRRRPTRIGRDCEIGPNTIILDSRVGDRSRVFCSVVEGSIVEADVQMGPFSHLRPGCHVGSGVELGNYAEAKNARLGRDTRMHHFSYVGDATVGERVNIGAGSITCNFDGQAKHRTVIGDDAFIGSDSMLVAPVEIGPGARTGAGSVVTRDVPAGETVLGVPARPRKVPRTVPTGPEKDGG